jgi:antitoxin component of MazEF toxin-antitoxin module
MPSLTIRKLFKLGNSTLVMTLPKAWIDYFKLKAGDELEVIANKALVGASARQHGESIALSALHTAQIYYRPYVSMLQ